jgi:hypothetical protein
MAAQAAIHASLNDCFGEVVKVAAANGILLPKENAEGGVDGRLRGHDG